MNYYLFIPFAIIVIFMLPLKIKVKFSCNLLDKNGAFAIFLFDKKLLHQQFLIKKGKILLQDEQNSSSTEIEFDSKEVIFTKVFANQLENKTRLKDLFLFYNVDVQDAFASGMLAGAINLFMLIFFTSLKNTKPTASLAVYDTVSYNRLVLEFALKSCLSISLFDWVYSFVLSLIITNRIAKQKFEKKAFAEGDK